MRFSFQKQFSVGFLMGECTSSTWRVCDVASVPSVISIGLLCSFVSVTPRHGCSPVKLLRIFRTHLCGSTYGGMLLPFAKVLVSLIVHFKGTFY